MTPPLVLDACCGGRMFWFDKKDPRACFVDNREYENKVVNNNGKKPRLFSVKPDMLMDFRKMNIESDQYALVVFDPPHLRRKDLNAKYSTRYYGALDPKTWREDLRAGFKECFRVLKPQGTLIFKWCETEIPLKDILALTPEKPLFGHRSGKASKTHWVAFIKSL